MPESGEPRSSRPGSQSALRELNSNRITSALKASGELSQADLARQTGLAPATISNIVHELEDLGIVAVRERGGRRRSVRLAEAAGFVVGVDYGHRHATVAVADLSHDILAERSESFAQELTPEVGLALAGSLVRDALAEAGVEAGAVVSAAMGVPAPIERATGRVGSPTIMPSWVGVSVSELATAAFGLSVPVAVDNDSNLGALAEHRWGAGIGVADLAYLKLSEGVGAGLIIGGRVYAGPAGTAGEIGHTTVDDFGAVCRCGNRGCLETTVSARSVVTLLEATHGVGLTITDVVRLADGGDRACARVLEDAGLQLGIAIADLCSLLNPDLVVVGGELAQAHAYLLPAIRRVVSRRGVPAATNGLRITTASLGRRTHVLGAIALALDPLPMPAAH